MAIHIDDLEIGDYIYREDDWREVVDVDRRSGYGIYVWYLRRGWLNATTEWTFVGPGKKVMARKAKNDTNKS